MYFLLILIQGLVILAYPAQVSPVEEHRQTLEGEEFEEIVEQYQLEPQASKSLVGSLAASTLGDGDSLGGGRLGNTVSSNE